MSTKAPPLPEPLPLPLPQAEPAALRDLVLITQPDEGRQLAAILTTFNPALRVRVATTAAEMEDALADPTGVRLLTALTGVIVPARLIARLTVPAYNLHPGPPTHPGKYPAPFALYDGAAEFGATAHELTAQVDAGPIVGVELAPVPPEAGIGWFHAEGYRLFMRLFLRLAPHLATETAPLPRLPVTWGERRCSQAALDRLRHLPEAITEEEVERRVRAFGHLRHAPLTVKAHGRRWTLAAEP